MKEYSQNYRREHYLRNREAILAEEKRRRAEDPEWAEKKRASGRAWYWANKAKKNAHARENYKKNRDRRLAQTKAYNRAHPEIRKKTKENANASGYFNRQGKKKRDELRLGYCKALLLDKYTGDDRAAMLKMLNENPQLVKAYQAALKLKRAIDGKKKES